MFGKVKKAIRVLSGDGLKQQSNDTELLALGALLSNQQYQINSPNIHDYEFKIFSQFGDDGIIQYLIKHVAIRNKVFIEFGVENYLESNTRFLMCHNNWSGFVMDGSQEAMDSLKSQAWYWRYALRQKAVFIDKENINGLLKETGYSDIGFLHIDLDGNDYHIFDSLDLGSLNPAIIAVEYNSVFGKERAITVPYDKAFVRTSRHFSNLFWGASLPALHHVAKKKSYALVGCNLAGNNAYFVRRDLLTDKVRELSVGEAFVESKFRESRDINYALTYLEGNQRLELIRGLEVINVITGTPEKL